MNKNYETPSFDKTALTCPHCNAFAAMYWNWLQLFAAVAKPVQIKTATCHRCGNFSIWRTDGNFTNATMVDPVIQIAPLPNGDLPLNCMQDYLEARIISTSSPRGAAALLRLCIQKLCIEIGGKWITC